ncbi:hypothetical protein D9615_005706 [Tricholomella constricta]|uniref:NTF2-like protein n=1 Tax=Tricholomella constricta TaxID=117010 RepID=A0A8H5M3W5_9AGAR|nr:hypothetical protein D9615_005706 [Tricholomella constricta]
MFSSPTPAPGSRAIASNALRSAGLIDRDATMRDLTDKPGGRKASSKIRSHRPRLLDMKELRDPRLRGSSSAQAGPSDPLTIRGAARVKLRKSLPGAAGPGVAPRVKTKFKAVELWKEVVQKRWNPETQFLNLESLIDDELIKKHNLAPPGRGGDARDAAVIFKIASQLKPKVQTLSLADNNLQGAHLQFLSHYLPELVNLSLQNNNIRNIKDLDWLASRRGRLQHLRELILLGNPLQQQGMQLENGEKYRRDITTRFLSLEVLDQVAIAQIAFDRPGPSSTPAERPSATTFPCEMGPSFVTGVDGSIVSNFLVRFFNALDTHRSALIDAYDPNATFSFSANTTIAARARVQGFHTSMPNQTKLTWRDWLGKGSRNLARINSDFDRALKSLHIGAEDAVKALVALPATKHDISGPPEKFCLDSFPVVHGQGMGLLLTVHGQFTEIGTGGIRSFDRSFILMPAPEGSRAKLNGWDVVIVSDQWTVRVYSSHEAWKPGPMLVQALSREEQEARNAATTTAPQPSQPLPLPFDPQAALASMPEPQRNLVMQVCQRTGLNVRFSIDCLAGNGWGLDRAIANFEQVKATLSRDAFL